MAWVNLGTVNLGGDEKGHMLQTHLSDLHGAGARAKSKVGIKSLCDFSLW